MIKQLNDKSTYIKFFTPMLLVLSILIIYMTFNIYNKSIDSTKTSDELNKNIYEIVYFDEVLTMSSRMAVLTGDKKWIERYHSFVPKLEVAIKNSSALVPEINSYLQNVDKANQELISIELKSIQLLEDKKQNKAKDLLFSQRYVNNKKIYTNGINQSIDVIKEKRKQRANQIQKELFLSIIAISILLVVNLYLARIMIRYLSNYNKKLNEDIESHVIKYKITEQKLLEERNKAQTYLELAGSIIVALDNKGNISLINRSGAELLQSTEAEMIGCNWFEEFLVTQELEELKGYFNSLMEGDLEPNKLVENKVRTSKGNILDISWYNSLIYEDDQIVGVLSSGTDITDIINTKEELKSSYDLLKKLAKNAPGLIYQYKLFPDGHSSFPYASDGMKNIYEVDPKDVINDAQAVFDILHPDDLNMITSSIKDSAETMHDWNVQYRVKLPKKGLRWLEGFAKPEKLEDDSILWHGYIHDITDRKDVENSLITSEESFRVIFEQSPFGIAVIDSYTGHIYKVNKLFATIAGRTVEKMADIDWLAITHPDDIQEDFDNMKRLNSGETTGFNMKKRYIHPDGSFVWVNMTITPLNEKDGSHTRHLCMIEDITKQKKLENELKKKDKLMIAQSRHAAMGEMIGMIAHQWRQPLQIINMNVNNTLADIDFEEITMENLREYNDSILIQTEHLTKTIDDFKNFFSPNQEKEDIPILSVIEETNSIIGSSLKNSSITLNISCNSHIKASIYKRELVQVILNLINNSKHAIVSNKIENGHIDIEVAEEDNWVILKVSDNGGGISNENIEKIFDPYFTTKGVSSGTGLGLYISKTIVETHLSGTIKVYNIDGGVCFEIKIPKIKEES